MSLYDYIESMEVQSKCYQFYALIMAAMCQADTDNMERLRSAFPETYRELVARYSALNGILANDGASVIHESDGSTSYILPDPLPWYCVECGHEVRFENASAMHFDVYGHTPRKDE